MQGLVSVVIASYNHALYISEALQSVLNQSYQRFEVIITDDGSTDNSVEIIQKFTDPRITLFAFSENRGACEATNNSINHANGEYIAIMNSDDVWVYNKLEKQVSFLQQNKYADAVFSYAEFLDENLKEFALKEKLYLYEIFKQSNRTSAEWLEKFFFHGNCLCHPSILIKKDCYKKLGLYDNRFRQLPDFDMWIKFCKHFTLHILPENLVKFRILKNNMNASSPTIQNQIRGRNEHYLIMKSFFTDITLEKFKEAFSNHLKNKNCSSQIEFEIEQAFLYIKVNHTIMIGIEMLYEFLSKDSYKKVLKESYKFGDKEFQNLLGSSNVFGIQDISAMLSLIYAKCYHYPKIKLFKILIIRTYSFIKYKLKKYNQHKGNYDSN